LGFNVGLYLELATQTATTPATSAATCIDVTDCFALEVTGGYKCATASPANNTGLSRTISDSPWSIRPLRSSNSNFADLPILPFGSLPFLRSSCGDETWNDEALRARLPKRLSLVGYHLKVMVLHPLLLHE